MSYYPEFDNSATMSDLRKRIHELKEENESLRTRNDQLSEENEIAQGAYNRLMREADRAADQGLIPNTPQAKRNWARV